MSSNLQTRLDQLQLFNERSSSIASNLNLDDLAKQVIKLIQETLGYLHIHFYTIDPLDGEIAHQSGKVLQEKHLTRNEMNIEGKGDSVLHVFHSKSPLIIDDFRIETGFTPTAKIDDILSELVVPLIYNGDVLGIIEIQSDEPQSFDKDDLIVMESLAKTIAVALRNTNRFQLEQRKISIAERLREVIGLLSLDSNSTQVLERILKAVLNTLPASIAAFWILDEEYDDVEINPELRLAAIDGYSIEQTNGGDQGLYREIILGSSTDELVEKFELDESVKVWSTRVIDSNVPFIRESGMEYEPFGAVIGFEPNYSAIFAPMRIGDRLIGILSLVHSEQRKYGKDSLELCSTFASNTAVYFENSRMYEKARDQAWISTVLFQVAEETQSIASLDELLQTIVHIIPELIKTQSCAILLWDDYVELFVPSVAYGLSSLQFEEFENWYIAESDVPAFDRLRFTKAPVILDPDNVTAGNFDNTYFASYNFSSGLFVLFPMVSQSEVIGAILVDFKGEHEEFDGEISLWEEKFTIIHGIANQTAVAIENIQLIQNQEEEAYVSIALLQVAQAIVSSSNLEEVLAAIVRITPILVGIRRSVIFLWDNDQEIYRASQAYGFSREEISDMQPIYSPSDFPFLDSVRQNNKLVYYSISKPLDPFEWAHINAEDLSLAENYTGDLKDQLNQQKLLQSKDPLLMGFPLAVKGNVLGIMLVEEVGQSPEVPSARIREKRFEIVTGISQQTAIAIQNSILQREVFERERLEREMQLAREIQNTFLPEVIPKIKDWDIAVRWRPARQVGGDFYDVFTLSEDKLGIVIADVADKGMPAALYMTLVRTLIRAAVQDQFSPQEVLLRVNNLLVPDSRQGMFVTLVYAVLSVETGELIFANAGHNPPLSLSSRSQQISEHNRDAMALGVFQDIDIQESKIFLEEGDLILFYTDGITEALSAEEEFFGMDRLKKVLVTSNFDSSSTLLDFVEESVYDFSQGMSQSDDITLVAIFRTSA